MLIDLPPGCRFADRCPYVADRCRTETPALLDVGNGHRAACHFADVLDLPGPAAEHSEIAASDQYPVPA
jgi:ABC-type antimicrobial peptide transport system ATPase subunit